jgi:hypothetical protein
MAQTLDHLEELARFNQWARFFAEVEQAKLGQFSAEEILSLAVVARRAYRLSMAIRLLRPFVHDVNGLIDGSADSRALSEYATCLTMLGARKVSLPSVEESRSAKP